MNDLNTLLGTVFFAWFMTFMVSIIFDGIFSIFKK